MNLSLTVQEAQVLIQLLDIANKAAGLQVAQACIGFHQRIQQMLADSPKELAKVVKKAKSTDNDNKEKTNTP
jgi:hypothetical protein